MSIIDGHTCIGDDGGTPNRRCLACFKEQTEGSWEIKRPEPQFAPIPGVLVLGIGHRARQGKDTVAAAMLQAAPADVLRIGFADALYDYCRVVHDMTVKDPKLLQEAGVALRETDPLVWVKAVYWKIIDKKPKVVVIPDVRFKNEAAFVKQMGGYCIKVERRHVSMDPTLNDTPWVSADRDPNHVSECDLNDHAWDLTITNRDLFTIRHHACTALNFFRQKHALEGATHASR